MKYFMIAILLLSLNLFAHEADEVAVGKFSPRFGGKVAAVIEEAHHHGKEAHHDETKFMAEILISDDNKVRLYFYDLHMKDLDLGKFPAHLKAKIKSRTDAKDMVLNKSGKNYVGDLPALKKRPFDSTFEFSDGSAHLHINFKALD